MLKILKTIFLCSLFFIALSFVGAQTVPPAPTNLTVEQMMNNAKLQWNISENAIGYKVYKSVDTLPFIPIALVKMNSYADQLVPVGHIYRYYVTAYNHNGESDPSNDVVFIPNAPPPNMKRGVIAGTIVDDSSGLPICCVRVRFFTPNGFEYFREAHTDTLGYYSIHIDSGAYYVYASKWTYVPEWYDNAVHLEDASLVQVNPNDTSYANFGLTRINVPPYNRLVSVSGAVIDSSTGEPIQDAFVVIMRTNRVINAIRNQDGNLFGSRSETFYLPEFGTLLGVMRVVKTDQNGNYTVQVPDSMKYIMLAFKKGYIPEFFKDKRTPFDADRLFFISDTSGINFDLIPKPLTQNSVSGMVKNENGDGVISKVVLFYVSPNGVFPVICGMTDTMGNYTFNSLYKGYYFAKAVPLTGYAPAWYDNEICGAKWYQADIFYVDSVVTGIDICVKPILENGLASISGVIRSVENGYAVQGVTVYAVSLASDEIVGFDITEEDGTYEIRNLAPGSYKIVVDKEEYKASETPIAVVDAVNSYSANIDVNILSDPLSVNDKSASVPTNFSLSQNYPNPFNPSTEIHFSIPSESFVNISVYNILGQLVANLMEKNLAVGNYSIVWDSRVERGNTISTGIYFYKMTAKPLDNSPAFTAVRKMLIVK